MVEAVGQGDSARALRLSRLEHGGVGRSVSLEAVVRPQYRRALDLVVVQPDRVFLRGDCGVGEDGQERLAGIRNQVSARGGACSGA